MTQFPVGGASGVSRRPIQIGDRAARVLATELARHGGPKTGLLVGAPAGSATLAAAIDALLPEDRLTVVATAASGATGAGGGRFGAAAALREHVERQGRWVTDRTRVVESLADAEPADVVILAEPLAGSADDARAVLADLTKLVNAGGVLTVVVPATRLPNGAADEVERQAALYGVGSDLVLRNVPPVRVHRLRHTPAHHAAASNLLPALRPSSVPLTRGMHIDSNGVAAAGIALGLAALAKAARPKSKLWLVPALAAAPVAAFFRDPQRDVPEDSSAVVAASDGKVLGVERLHDKRFGDMEFLRIAVFLSVLDVHVNRAPVAGKVVDYFVEDGGYAAAMKPEAEHNVAAYTLLETAHGPVAVVQRTGLIARRIVQRAPVGSLLAKGERFGLIRFGSRTDVYLPADKATPAVAPGDRVVGGATVIATWL
ncbi:phosphatidylserine decarboxylase [Dactylosporangium aurantiacum]|uniref:Phosphatidylserine decarboxylase n=1 Tax=Dactylosporangium aurantiacum TaxID=35754 RepID=A0A9Q9IEU4_9ACTN|nr:phosphatidylserine decarboxylase [Dactylosporangium aurantiacum]MDG6105374.1 phosphatidylserine decarboxylase [Dactylosporangium aurantiacum]UWZ54081.1 phosphatidylserine decarboxylase [Dactylosporangium aurantiacum]